MDKSIIKDIEERWRVGFKFRVKAVSDTMYAVVVTVSDAEYIVDFFTLLNNLNRDKFETPLFATREDCFQNNPVAHLHVENDCEKVYLSCSSNDGYYLSCRTFKAKEYVSHLMSVIEELVSIRISKKDTIYDSMIYDNVMYNNLLDKELMRALLKSYNSKLGDLFK